MERLLQFLALLAAVTLLPLVIVAFIASLHQPKVPNRTSSGQLIVRIDGIDMISPDLPQLTFWSSGEIVPISSPNITSFSLQRGGSYGSHSPLDDALASLSSYPDLGIITKLEIGPVRQKNNADPVRCMDRPVTVLERESSIFCFAETEEFFNFRQDAVSFILTSNSLQFFDAPVRMACSTWWIRIDEDKMSCSIRGTMPNGLGARFDFYSNEQTPLTWPYIDANREEWQMHITAMENVFLSMVAE